MSSREHSHAYQNRRPAGHCHRPFCFGFTPESWFLPRDAHWGELFPIADAPRLAPEDTLDMAFSIMSNRQKQKLKEFSEVDIAYSVSGLGRFRANIFQQRGSVSIVLRVIPDQTKNAAELGLPPVVEQDL